MKAIKMNEIRSLSPKVIPLKVGEVLDYKVNERIYNIEKRLVINTIKKEKQDSKKIKEIISMVIDQGGIHYAEKKNA